MAYRGLAAESLCSRCTMPEGTVMCLLKRVWQPHKRKAAQLSLWLVGKVMAAIKTEKL